jgi:glutaredoxin
LRRHKIIFTEVDIQKDAEARQYLIDNGVMGTPAVRVGQKLMRSPEDIITWAKANSRRDEG